MAQIIDPMRGMLMDLGLGELLRFIDKRFGPSATTLLIVMLFIAVFSWTLQVVVEGIQLLSSLAESRSILQRVIYWAASTAFYGCLLYGGMKYLEYRTDKALEAANKLLADAKNLEENVKQQLEEVKKQSEEVDKASDFVLSKIEELKRLPNDRA